MIETITINCPNCGTLLNFEKGRSQAFCMHCGEKLYLSDEKECADGTDVKADETDRQRMIEQEQLKEKQAEEERRNKLLKRCWIVFTVVYLILGCIGLVIGSRGLLTALYIGLFSAISGLLTILTKKL